MLDPDTEADVDTIVDAANLIESRLSPETVARIRITWRDTELGQFEEEAVKELGHHTI